MNHAEQMALYDRLSRAFGRKPRESLNEAARRAQSLCRGRKKRAALALLGPRLASEDPWSVMARADRLARGVAL